ncbi:MAG: hypothetical protein KKD38_05760 [Candidatus Delongbacteria bacterium]|nr:hypothetical protein [Candidatus Delongbacteria bacterium]MCG2759586.1 hypothetical protein [Candidatus Delongbacteria bacterium]
MRCYPYIILSLVTLLFSDIKIFTNKTELFTGERLKISIEFDHPEGSSVDLTNIQNSINEDFDLVNSQVKTQSKENVIIKETILNDYAVFAKPGEHYFGPIEYSYIKDEKELKFASDSIRINVKSILKEGSVTVVDSLGNQKQIPLDSLNMVLPIKNIGIYKMSVREKGYIGIFLALLVLLVMSIYFLMRRSKKKNGTDEVAAEKKVPAHIIAFKMLDLLKEKKYLEKGEFKEFAAELSLIFRNFLEDRFDFPGAELPTEDLKKEIRSRVTDDETIADSDKLLEVTDFVKYAKFIPLDAELKAFLEFAYKAVGKLKEESKVKNK